MLDTIYAYIIFKEESIVIANKCRKDIYVLLII